MVDFKFLTLPNDIDAIINLLGCDRKDLKTVIFSFFKEFNIQYHDFGEWFDKIYSECFLIVNVIKRNIVVAFDGSSIAGILILKDSPDEKKVCTLVVAQNYRRMGLATKFFELSFDILNTLKPHYTVSEDNLPTFEGLNNKFAFICTGIVDYNGKLEYHFN